MNQPQSVTTPRTSAHRIMKVLFYPIAAVLLLLLLQLALKPIPVSAAPDTQDGHVSAVPANGNEPYVFVVRGGRLYVYYLKLSGRQSKLVLMDSVNIGATH